MPIDPVTGYEYPEGVVTEDRLPTPEEIASVEKADAMAAEAAAAEDAQAADAASVSMFGAAPSEP